MHICAFKDKNNYLLAILIYIKKKNYNIFLKI